MAKKFPHYKQADAKDCGATCLKIIAKHSRRTLNIQTLRELSETTHSPHFWQVFISAPNNSSNVTPKIFTNSGMYLTEGSVFSFSQLAYVFWSMPNFSAMSCREYFVWLLNINNFYPILIIPK